MAGSFPNTPAHFEAESAVLRGDQGKAGRGQSVVLFTVHKSGSAFMGEMLKFLCQESGLTPLNLMGYLSINNIPEYTIVGSRRLRRSFHPTGYFYGPLRFYHHIPRLNRYKILLLLRDPRDTLTSLYYSRTYSHVVENEYHRRLREDALQQNIDAFCLQLASNRKLLYENYLRTLAERPNVLILKYEDMVADFPVFLDRIIRFLGYAPSAYLRQAILNEADFKVEKEDIYAHKRQVAPGDHLRKLKPGTIRELNRVFAGILGRLDYPIS